MDDMLPDMPGSGARISGQRSVFNMTCPACTSRWLNQVPLDM